jgi:N utilization substance protein A
VPEVDDGIVQIMGVARDPGSRAKVAVLSRERDVDPVGACVGVRGSRIQNIVQELRSERIDIVVWSPDIAAYARNALSPAVISRIVVDEAEGLLEVIVPDDQLTNSIGRKGQNVKLAAKLLGWKIDIYTETRYNEANAIGRGLEQLAAVVDVPAENFAAAGLVSFEAVSLATDEELLAVAGVTEEKIGNLRAAVNFLRPSGEKGNVGGADDAPAPDTADENDAAAPGTADAKDTDDAGDAAGAGEADDDAATRGTAGEAAGEAAEDAAATDNPAETNSAD